ncbi:MAG TPA: primosomal protein N', partial [Chthoniobacterales bacterium]|nr:primosomal protein N' [Chthoniobacterales bacterium]
WESKVHVGSRVKVPLRSRNSFATVVELVAESTAPGIKPLTALVSEEPVLAPRMLQLARWMADYYCCPLDAAVRCTLPQVIRSGGFKRERWLSVTLPTGENILEQIKVRAPRQAEVLEVALQFTGPIRWAELFEAAATSDRTIKQLVNQGWLTLQMVNAERDPSQGEEYVPTAPLRLNPGQASILTMLEEAIDQGKTKPTLLHGITGSGKTEIYLQAIQHCLNLGRGALVLVPEISLTPQTVERFKSRFARELIAVLHSHLSAGERHDEWHRLRRGDARVAIGARSAVFAPVKNLAFIVVDEEHENSYKQEETPRYHARDLAVVRGQIEGCAVLLGSATPSLESYHNARIGKYELARLTARVDDRQLPLIRVVDLRQEFAKSKRPSILSRRLTQAIEDRLQKREQSILFLNRRGFASSLLCSKCGYVCECANCSIPLTFHLAENRLKCHLCGYQAVAPKKCPGCSDPGIRYSGYGTEKVIELVEKLFPTAHAARMDADSMSRKDAYRTTLGAFRSGKIDILIGTQMIAKGLDFPNVTLVGIINADIGLHIPDFRAGERTFQLLTQVAGRAGRGETPGEVFVQTATPFSPSIQFARHHDFDGFWDQEREFRERCDYPPFNHLVLIQIKSEHQRLAEFTAETLHRRFSEKIESSVTLHPVVPAQIERVKGFYRFQILLRTRAILRLSRAIREVMDSLSFPDEVQVSVDVDPYQLL